MTTSNNICTPEEKNLLITLLEKCLTDKNNYIKISDGGKGKEFTYKEHWRWQPTILKSICRSGSQKALKQHKLKSEEDTYTQRGSYFHSLEFKFDNQPPLVLKRTTKQEPAEESELNLTVKNFFGKTSIEKIDVATTHTTIIYTLSHGLIKCELTDDEGNAYINQYKEIAEKIDREIDFIKLYKRVKNYPHVK